MCLQAEDGIRGLVRSRGLGDVYKRRVVTFAVRYVYSAGLFADANNRVPLVKDCLLYTSDADDDLLCVDHGGRRILTTHTLSRSSYFSSTNPLTIK